MEPNDQQRLIEKLKRIEALFADRAATPGEKAAAGEARDRIRQRRPVPEWADANDWAAVVDPELAPSIILAERFGLLPEIFVAGDGLSPAVFMNDEHRIKVRHFSAVLVADFRGLHKSNV